MLLKRGMVRLAESSQSRTTPSKMSSPLVLTETVCSLLFEAIASDKSIYN